MPWASAMEVTRSSFSSVGESSDAVQACILRRILHSRESVVGEERRDVPQSIEAAK